jgi:Domain of unknown function (DUF4286)
MNKAWLKKKKIIAVMIVLNITTQVDAAIEGNWLQWQSGEFIPCMLQTGHFDEHRFFRLLEQDPQGGITYVTQYLTTSLVRYRAYLEEFASLHRKMAAQKWGVEFVSFHTLMESVN